MPRRSGRSRSRPGVTATRGRPASPETGYTSPGADDTVSATPEAVVVVAGEVKESL